MFFQPDVAIETFYTMDPAILTSADWHKSQQAWQAAKDAGKRAAFDSAATATAGRPMSALLGWHWQWRLLPIWLHAPAVLV